MLNLPFSHIPIPLPYQLFLNLTITHFRIPNYLILVFLIHLRGLVHPIIVDFGFLFAAEEGFKFGQKSDFFGRVLAKSAEILLRRDNVFFVFLFFLLELEIFYVLFYFSKLYV